MYSPNQIDPAVSFRNSQGQQVRGTIITLQRRALVMEVYNPYSIVQVSEVLSDLSIKMGTRQAYIGKAVVVSLVNTGLTAVVSVTLTEEWRGLADVQDSPKLVGDEARAFVQDWEERFRIRHDYQIVVNEMRAFLAEVSRWVEQVDLSDSLPKEGTNRLRMDVFQELAEPIMLKVKYFQDWLDSRAADVEPELAPAHRSFAQSALHPLLLRAPFVYRTYTKPLGYAGDYEMVNQIISDPREGPSTYFQIVNATFLNAAVARAHRNRIEILVQYLNDLAEQALAAGRQFKVLNVGCGPAVEIQRFIRQHPAPQQLAFQLVDFSEETLDYTRRQMDDVRHATSKHVDIEFVHESVHQLLKRRVEPDSPEMGEFDAVYCAGLFDYLSDKVCSRLLAHFAARTRKGGALLVTNVHGSNPEKLSMEHLLEWYLVYRDEARMESMLPAGSGNVRLFTDDTGVNVFAQARVGGEHV
ncbi:class I SAM-dependent methyltransferase PhcB [Ralstonia pseudosolanacearum]|uniref:class I SAM-dependent methyltransferase PhcB n=1 Tax=Ralstonia pseudosolanacearum TaxID=1310165 RepID=UPI001FFB3F2E|nr:class I SAM-dependent methyltransferase PhcB [Ralstonia pseudosolanacearum]